eukprot:1509338-Rhodomonas_salina.1
MLLLPGPESVLFGHATHVRALSAPDTDEYVPAAQAMQTPFPIPSLQEQFLASVERCGEAEYGGHTGPDPFVALKVPGTHTEHISPPYPASHARPHAGLPAVDSVPFGQSSHPVAAVAFWNFPASHSKQSEDPFTALKLPAAHALHSRPPYPALQRHCRAPAVEAESFPHGWHSIAPLSFRNVPGAHS